MADMTPEQWLTSLAKRMDDEGPRFTLLRNYLTGNSPLPEMSPTTRESWIRFQKKSRTGMAGLTVDSLANRMNPQGFTIGNTLAADADTDESPEVESLEVPARRLWKTSRLAVTFSDAVWEALGMSRSYLMLAEDAGQPIITMEKVEYVCAAPDPLRPWRARAAIKVWRDEDGFDYVYVWVPGIRQRFKRPTRSKNGKVQAKISGGWEIDGEPVEAAAIPPVYILENKGGKSEFEEHTDLIDRIHEGILQRLVIIAYQAFKQRAVKGDLTDEDEDGNPHDWANLLSAAPGAMWELPSGVDIWESQTTDITPILAASKDDMRQYCAVTHTPVPDLLPDGANQTAEGAVSAREGLIFKAMDRIARMSAPFEEISADALRILVPEFTDVVEIQWAPPQLASLQERYAAAVQAKAAGMPWHSIMTDILGFSEDKVDQMELQLASEQLQMSALMGVASGQPGSTPAAIGTGPGGPSPARAITAG
jgi:hypothetical protein